MNKGIMEIIEGTKEEYLTQKNYFEQLIDNFPNAVVALDNDYKIININKAFKDMFQYDIEEIKNESIVSLLCPDNYYNQIITIRNDVLYSKGISSLETVRKRKDGTLINVLGYTYPIIYQDNQIGRYIIYIDITDKKNIENKIKFLAHKDRLTSLDNKDSFKTKLENQINEFKSQNKKMALLFLDINQFKNINDNLGHNVGDKILELFANRLSNLVDEDVLTARYAGDEFLIGVPNIKSNENLVSIANNILKSFENPFEYNGNKIYLSSSMGISIYPEHGDDFDSLLRSADIAMHKAKEYRSNRYEIYDYNLQSEIKERFLIDSYLRDALKREEFYLNYQPIIDTKTGMIIGTEALIRWKSSNIGFIGPDKFIPISESNGMIISIGEWVLKTACKQIKKWHSIGFDDMFMSINISIKQLEQNDFAELVKEILNDLQLDPKHLILEITETVYMENLEKIYKNLEKLNKIGVRLSIDDFGTGYSSLAQLGRLEIDKLKIDKSFIMDIHLNNNNTKIVTAIIAMAKSLSLSIVAEGVEENSHFEFLKNAGCDMLQGYLFSKPLDDKSIEELLKKYQSKLL